MAHTTAGVHSEACPLRRRHRRGAAPAELCALEFWRALIAECVGTFVSVFLSCGAHVSWPLHSVTTLTKSFCAGFAVATASHATAGAHANPALTLAALVAGKTTPLRATLYAGAQCGGAVAAAVLLYGVTSPSPSSLMGCTLVDPSLSPWQAAALEAVLTCVLALTLLASQGNNATGGRDSLALGIAYLAASIVALPATGASMNPARSLGPAFVMNIWTHHWVYWCGPTTGGVVAGLIYEYILDDSRDRRTMLGVKGDSDKEVRDDSKSGAARLIFRTTPEGSTRPPPPQPSGGGGSQTAVQCGRHPAMQAVSRYSTMPPPGGAAAYRTRSAASDYGASSRQQFKF